MLQKFFLSTYITFDLGYLYQVSSILNNKREEYSVDECIVINGYNKIPNYLAKGIKCIIKSTGK